MSANGGGRAPIRVSIDPELESLVPVFLEHRRAEIPGLRANVAAGDLEALRFAGHSLKGVGAGYGFDRLSELGLRLEECARSGDLAGSGEAVEAIVDYVERVQVVYEET